MAEIFNFNVQDNRSIQFPKANLLEPIMQEDHNVAIWRFRIPKVLNGIDMSGWAWWFVYVNAKGQKFTELLTLVDDIDESDEYCTADYSIDYRVSYNPGSFAFSLESVNADVTGAILQEWHTKTYHKDVDRTLQGNQAQWAETESDIISALIVTVQNRVNQLVGGATPEPVSLIADMTDTSKVYLYVGSEEDESNGYWYYHNGTRFVPGGLYASGITVDAVPTQGSNNAVRSGGVYEENRKTGLAINAVENFVSEERQMVKRAFMGDHSYNALTVIADADTLTINGQSTSNAEVFLLDTDKEIAQHCGSFNANFFNIYNPQHVKSIVNGHKYTLNFELLSGSITRGGVTYTDFADVGSASVVRAFLVKADATTESYSQNDYYLIRCVTGSTTSVLTVDSIGALALYIYPNTTCNNAVIRINLVDETAKESDFVDKFNATEVGKEFQIVDQKVERFENDYYASIVHTVSEWDAGGISTSGGNTSTEAQLLGRRRNHIRLVLDESQKENDMFITVDDGYQAQLYEYEDTGGKWDASTFKQIKFTWFEGTKLFTVPSVTGYRVAIRKSDGTNFDGTEDLTGAVICKTIRTSGTYDNQNIVKRNDVVRTDLKLQQLNRPTRIGTRELATLPFCLIHFSDVHGDAVCLKNVIDYYNHYSGYIDDVIHTGDTVTKTSEDGTEFWADTEGAEKILNVIGNHDTRVITDGVTDWTALDMTESYDTYFAPYISEWDVNYSSGKTYYYKDYTSKKIRLIVIDIMHQTSDQLAWFASTLASAKTAGLHVICACHSRAHWQFTSYNTAWDDKVHSPEYSGGYSYGDTSGYSGTNYPSNLSNDYANAVDDFIDAGGNFVCWIHGHTHYKIFAVLTAHPNQLNIAVANNSRPQYAWTYVWARISGTKSEDDFNVIAVDTYSKILRIMKVGVDYDRYMRHIDTISYDYANHNILYSG